jgi:phosphoglycerate kinase
MVLPGINDLSVKNKKVLLRTNYDVPLKPSSLAIADDTRIKESLPTIEYLLRQNSSVIILSHLGRPGGKRVEKLSLKPVKEALSNFLKKDIFLAQKIEELKNLDVKIAMLENLRFWPGEEKNDSRFAQKLASLADFYINDAFAVSHRRHASLVGLPKFLPSAFGLDFLKEIETLRATRENPARPVVLILGGKKKGKLTMGLKLIQWADWVLIGGIAATYRSEIKPIKKATRNLVVATRKGEDITLKAIDKFAKLIRKARTIVWTGPMGEYEVSQYERGTKRVAELVADSSAFKLVGGGDTEAALTKFGLEKKIDYICSGGGAMLVFLAEGTLPVIGAMTKDGKNCN